MLVRRCRRSFLFYDNVIYLVIDFLGMGVLPHHALRPSKREQGRLITDAIEDAGDALPTSKTKKDEAKAEQQIQSHTFLN